MIRPGKTDGMETPTSMMLLLAALALIFSAAGHFLSSSGTDEDLFELRLLQARSVGSVITAHVPAGGSVPLADMVAPEDCPMALLWDGTELIVLEGGPGALMDQFAEVLANAPDGLDCMLSFRLGGAQLELSGPAATWEGRNVRGVMIMVALPLRSGGIVNDPEVRS